MKLLILLLTVAAAQQPNQCTGRSSCRSCADPGFCVWCVGTSSCQQPGGTCAGDVSIVDWDCPDKPAYFPVLVAIDGLMILAGLLYFIYLIVISKQASREIGRTTFNTTVPAHVSQLLTDAGESNETVRWVGRSQVMMKFFVIVLIGGIGVPLISLAASFGISSELFLYFTILIKFMALGGLLYARGVVIRYEKRVYIITADTAYVFEPAGQGGCSMALTNQWRLANVDPSLADMEPNGVGSLIFESAVVATNRGMRTVSSGFAFIADASKVQSKIAELKAALPQQQKQEQQQPVQVQMIITTTQQQPLQPVQSAGQPMMFDPYTGKPLNQGQAPPPAYDANQSI